MINTEQIFVITAMLLLNVIVYYVLKHASKRIILRDIATHDAEINALQSHRSVWFKAKIACLVVWATIIPTWFFFFSYNFHEEIPSMGEAQTAIEAAKNIPTSKEEITISNFKIIKNEEVARQKKIDEERAKAREEFNNLLKEGGPE